MGLNLNWKELPVVQSRFLFYSAAAATVFLLLLLGLIFILVRLFNLTPEGIGNYLKKKKGALATEYTDNET